MILTDQVAHEHIQEDCIVFTMHTLSRVHSNTLHIVTRHVALCNHAHSPKCAPAGLTPYDPASCATGPHLSLPAAACCRTLLLLHISAHTLMFVALC
jgi:hypothetical protein